MRENHGILLAASSTLASLSSLCMKAEPTKSLSLGAMGEYITR